MLFGVGQVYLPLMFVSKIRKTLAFLNFLQTLAIFVIVYYFRSLHNAVTDNMYRESWPIKQYFRNQIQNWTSSYRIELSELPF